MRGNATGLTATCSLGLGVGAAGCGGIMAYGASPIIVGNTISGNVAAATSAATKVGYGGGVLLLYGSGLLQGNLIQGNVASNNSYGQGGGVDLEWTDARVEGNRVLSNTAVMSGIAYGGGIGGQPYGAIVVGNLIEGNRARASGGGYGGGLYEWLGLATYSGNRVRGNTGSEAVFLGHSASRFEGNLVLGNDSTDGIRLAGGCSTVLANNVVAHGGGAALATDAAASFPLSATLVCNTLAGSGMGTGLDVAPYSTMVLTDNIVTGFSLGITASVPASSTVLADHTLFWANADDGLQGTNAVDGEPAFRNAAAGDYHILVSSAARDAGVPVDLATDIDGAERPVGPAYDIGADEWGWLRRLPLVLRP